MTRNHHLHNPYAYRLDAAGLKYPEAKARKGSLRALGYRVKLWKDIEGLFQVWKKNVTLIAQQRGQGNGRKV